MGSLWTGNCGSTARLLDLGVGRIIGSSIIQHHQTWTIPWCFGLVEFNSFIFVNLSFLIY